MTRYAYVLTPSTRLSPGRSGQSGNTRDVHQIIPGSTIRGALGAAWWTSPDSAYQPSDKNGGQADFDRAFGELISVGPAEPTLDPNLARDIARFLPNSMLTCKYDCGAKPLDRAQKLPPRGTCCAAPDETGQADQICPKCERCPACAPQPGGGLGIKAVEGKGWSVHADVRSIIVRSALEADGTAKDAALFTRAVLEPRSRSDGKQVRYVGVLSLRDDDPAVSTWLHAVRTLRVGGSLGTMGKCSFELRELPPLPVSRAVEEGTVAIYLTTPAVLVDAGGVPTLDLAGAIEAAARASGAPHATVTRYWFRPATASGWHGLAGLPKPQDPIVDAGAVVQVTKLGGDALDQLLANGIGLRRMEGFGRLTLDPHVTEWVVAEQEPAVESAFVPVGELSEAAGPAADEVVAASTHPAPVVAPVTAVSAILASVPEEDASLVGRRLLEAARQSTRMRQSGNSDDQIGLHVLRTIHKPWAKALAGPVRDRIERLLLEPDLQESIIELETRTGGGK